MPRKKELKLTPVEKLARVWDGDWSQRQLAYGEKLMRSRRRSVVDSRAMPKQFTLLLIGQRLVPLLLIGMVFIGIAFFGQWARGVDSTYSRIGATLEARDKITPMMPSITPMPTVYDSMIGGIHNLPTLSPTEFSLPTPFNYMDFITPSPAP